jgi:hypothetical protein
MNRRFSFPQWRATHRVFMRVARSYSHGRQTLLTLGLAFFKTIQRRVNLTSYLPYQLTIMGNKVHLLRCRPSVQSVPIRSVDKYLMSQLQSIRTMPGGADTAPNGRSVYSTCGDTGHSLTDTTYLGHTYHHHPPRNCPLSWIPLCILLTMMMPSSSSSPPSTNNFLLRTALGSPSTRPTSLPSS